ncbi:MAG: hypothetical protein WDO12_02870 [Pseudomonadota bacterium]
MPWPALAFVAMSINLARIIETPGIAGRAAETILLLSATLAGCLIALVPGLSATQLGIGLLVVSLPTWAVAMSVQVHSLLNKTYFHINRAVLRFILLQVAALPAIWAGLSLCGFMPGGIMPFAASAILSMLVAILNAWILLIEILR